MRADPQLLLKPLILEVVGAAEHATDICADLHVVLAGRLEAEHGVVAGHVANIEGRDADAMRDLGDGRIGKITDFILRIKQQWESGRSA